MFSLLLLLQISFHPFFEADEQKHKEREFLSYSVEFVFDFSSFEIFQPTQFAVSDKGVFVANRSTNNLYYISFDQDSRPVGAGGGRGPFEFLSIGNVYTHGENVWALDMNNQKVSGFKIEDFSQFEEYTFSENIQSAYGTDEIIFKIRSGSSDLGIFVIKDLISGEVKKKYNYTGDESLLSMQYQGSVFVRNNKLCYIAYLANILKCWDTDFNILYSKQTIDGVREPVIEYVERSIPTGVVRGNAVLRGEIYTLAIDVSNNTIFHSIRDEVNEKTYIDLYSLDTGSYFGSLEFETNLYSNIAVQNNSVYVMQRDELSNNLLLIEYEN